MIGLGKELVPGNQNNEQTNFLMQTNYPALRICAKPVALISEGSAHEQSLWLDSLLSLQYESVGGWVMMTDGLKQRERERGTCMTRLTAWQMHKSVTFCNNTFPPYLPPHIESICTRLTSYLHNIFHLQMVQVLE